MVELEGLKYFMKMVACKILNELCYFDKIEAGMKMIWVVMKIIIFMLGYGII